jgi:hypothetical protein
VWWRHGPHSVRDSVPIRPKRSSYGGALLTAVFIIQVGMGQACRPCTKQYSQRKAYLIVAIGWEGVRGRVRMRHLFPPPAPDLQHGLCKTQQVQSTGGVGKGEQLSTGKAKKSTAVLCVGP